MDSHNREEHFISLTRTLKANFDLSNLTAMFIAVRIVSLVKIIQSLHFVGYLIDFFSDGLPSLYLS